MMLRKLLIQAIEIYQATLSPDHGPLRHLHPYGFCRKHPTCSDYAKHTIAEKGALIGSIVTAKRLILCHPWSRPDPERITASLER